MTTNYNRTEMHTAKQATSTMKPRLRRWAVLFALVGLLPLTHLSNGSRVARAQPAGAGQPVAVRWGFYITYNPNSWVSLQANARYLNYVSPWFYNLNASA